MIKHRTAGRSSVDTQAPGRATGVAPEVSPDVAIARRRDRPGSCSAVGPVLLRTSRGLLPVLLLSVLSGCQSLAPPKPSIVSEQIDQALAVLSSPEASRSKRRRAETDYRRTLARILPAVSAGETAPELTLATPDDGPTWRDPQTLTSITPVRRPPKAESGLQRAGLGAPAVGRIQPGGPNAPVRGYHVPVTALALPEHADEGEDLEDRRLRVALADPLRLESIELGGEQTRRPVYLPVAMDLEAPLDATRSMGPRPFDGLRYLLRADRFAGRSRITFLQPFDPDKRPLVLVHGLMTTPQMWNRLVRELLADATVRKHYQIWFFYYPTAQPPPLSALQLREALDEAVAEHGPTQPMVLVGYSMGGVLARAQIAGLRVEQAEWILPGVSKLPPASRVHRSLIFEPRDDISRVVFMFAPHRGSRLATLNLAVWTSRLIRLPLWVRTELEVLADGLAGVQEGRFPTSIQGLSPESRFLQALDQSPFDVPVHSVIGNRGRRHALARSSDGVVPYWSSHLPAAESELIVPTGHGGFSHPLAVAELIRVLKLDLPAE